MDRATSQQRVNTTAFPITIIMHNKSIYVHVHNSQAFDVHGVSEYAEPQYGQKSYFLW